MCPVGIALGAIAAVALIGTLVAQACSEEGFDNGMTVLGSSKDDAEAGSCCESGSSKKAALTTAATPADE